jgi:hypothetical protein
VLGQQAFQAVEGVVLDLVRVADRLGVGVGVALFVGRNWLRKSVKWVSTSAALGARKPTE